MRDAMRLVVGWFGINLFRKRGTQINLIQYQWSHVGVGEILFHHQVCNAWRHWWHATSQMSHETSDLFKTWWKIIIYVSLRIGLEGSTCSECPAERTCQFQPPQHVRRTSAGAQTCVWGPVGLPVCHGSESTRKDPRPEEKKMPKGEKTHLHI